MAKKFDEQDRFGIAAMAVLGMLAHSTRYRPKPEDVDAGRNWHQAIAKEGFDIADAFIAEARRRPPMGEASE